MTGITPPTQEVERLIERLGNHAYAIESGGACDLAFNDDAGVMRDAIALIRTLTTRTEEAEADVIEQTSANDYREKLAELYQWTGSAFLAGETIPDEGAAKAELYGFLCGLLGYLESAAESDDMIRTLTVRAEEAEARLREAVRALKRLGSMEEFTSPRACDARYYQELLARIEYARSKLTGVTASSRGGVQGKEDGRCPSDPGSRPSDGAASTGVSTVPASIPNAGDGQ